MESKLLRPNLFFWSSFLIGFTHRSDHIVLIHRKCIIYLLCRFVMSLNPIINFKREHVDWFLFCFGKVRRGKREKVLPLSKGKGRGKYDTILFVEQVHYSHLDNSFLTRSDLTEHTQIWDQSASLSRRITVYNFHHDVIYFIGDQSRKSNKINSSSHFFFVHFLLNLIWYSLGTKVFKWWGKWGFCDVIDDTLGSKDWFDSIGM